MKKVDEGVELFDDIWEKVYSAEQQNQKEKYEMDLKKEIKKLQRLRDQIKTWIGSSEVKDKDALLEARRLIETKMEQFKVCEKETKTKTYSKEGLAREEKLDPAEEAKLNTTTWLGEYIDQLNTMVEEQDFEIEKLSSGKGKKTNKHQIEELLDHIANHKFHINKLEGIIRLVNNDRLDTETVDNLKDDLDYYLDSCYEEDYMQAYDEEFFYEALGLDELNVVEVVTVAATAKKPDDSVSTASSRSKEKKGSKKSALASVIPLTIGRARTASSKKEPEPEKPSPVPTKTKTTSTTPKETTPKPTTPVPPPAPPQPTTSMAAMLKRESEQQEKERQQQKARAEQLRQQEVAARKEQERQAAAAAAAAAAAEPPAPEPTPLESLATGLAGLQLGATTATPVEAPAPDLDSPYLNALDESLLAAPQPVEQDRNRSYTPQNPYPTPASYPTTPLQPNVFDKLGVDCLFFIFYYAQGTYQQYLAARELKKQSWRFHKKYMTWFQRHEEPQIKTDEYEQGTYVYFDYETGWCTRIKSDFRFEYCYLEDSLQ